MAQAFRSLAAFLVSILFFSPSHAQNWWEISDPDFATKYKSLAIGTQAEQSRFAWMLFARANQQVPFGSEPRKYSQWELWPSDLDTFAPNVAAFTASAKVRVVPHLQISRLALARPHLFSALGPTPASEEVTRNPISYNYITGKKLHTRAGIAAFLNQPGAKVDFPIGAIETKAAWTTGSLAGAYQVAGFSLTALHLMIKIAPTPSDPFRDNTPSWFWTTFEFKSNTGLAAAQKFETYRDTLAANDITALLTEAGLASTPLVNYASDGEQIQFFDAANKVIRLGNTKLEWFLATPANQNPATWTQWSSSCHSCHAQASAQVSGGSVNIFSFGAPVGALTGPNLPPSGYQSLDFVWAFLGAR